MAKMSKREQKRADLQQMTQKSAMQKPTRMKMAPNQVTAEQVMKNTDKYIAKVYQDRAAAEKKAKSDQRDTAIGTSGSKKFREMNTFSRTPVRPYARVAKTVNEYVNANNVAKQTSDDALAAKKKATLSYQVKKAVVNTNPATLAFKGAKKFGKIAGDAYKANASKIKSFF